MKDQLLDDSRREMDRVEAEHRAMANRVYGKVDTVSAAPSGGANSKNEDLSRMLRTAAVLSFAAAASVGFASWAAKKDRELGKKNEIGGAGHADTGHR